MSITKVESRFRVFGKVCHLLLNVNQELAEDLLRAAEKEFRRIDSKFNSYNKTSVVALINQRAGSGEFTPLDAESRSLFHYVHALWDRSNHLYDPTTSVLQRYYDNNYVPGDAHSELQLGLSRVGWTKLEISPLGAHLSQAGMTIDLNSCTRPYAVDCVSKLLVKAGVTNALIDLDHDVATIGKQSDGANWLVGIRCPDGPRTTIERYKLNNKGYTVRGNFEKILQIDGERFPRALSPVDGHPVPGLLGIAVMADTCITACSAVSVARLKTEENALTWLDSLGLPWLAIDRELNCHGSILNSPH